LARETLIKAAAVANSNTRYRAWTRIEVKSAELILLRPYHIDFVGGASSAKSVDFNILWPTFQQSMATHPRRTRVNPLRLGI
jgi:hypothetical protein